MAPEKRESWANHRPEIPIESAIKEAGKGGSRMARVGTPKNKCQLLLVHSREQKFSHDDLKLLIDGLKQRFLCTCSSSPVPRPPSSECIPFAVEVSHIIVDVCLKTDIVQAIARSLTQARIPPRIPTRALVRRGIATNTSEVAAGSTVCFSNNRDWMLSD